MQSIQKSMVARAVGHEAGFTLIELLVVIGIIVALAAITVPLVTRFAGRGETGAIASESQTVQAAMDNLMADQGIIAVTAVSTGTPVSSFPTASGGTSVPGYTVVPGNTRRSLDFYLKNSTTTYCYGWDVNGKVTWVRKSVSTGVC